MDFEISVTGGPDRNQTGVQTVVKRASNDSNEIKLIKKELLTKPERKYYQSYVFSDFICKTVCISVDWAIRIKTGVIIISYYLQVLQEILDALLLIYSVLAVSLGKIEPNPQFCFSERKNKPFVAQALNPERSLLFDCRPLILNEL